MLVEFITVCGLFITAVVLFLLARKKGSISQGLLAVLFTTTFFFLLTYYADQNEVEWLFQIGLLGSNSIGYLLGPILLLYAKEAFRKKQYNFKQASLHFIPFVLHFVLITIPLSIQGYGSNSVFKYVAYWNAHSISFSFIENCYLFFYALLAFFTLQKGPSIVLQSKDLRWTRALVICTLLVLGLDILVVAYEIVWTELPINSSYVTVVSISLCSIYLALHGISSSRVLLHSFSARDTAEHSVRNAILPLSESEQKEHMEAIKQLMVERSPYLSPTLSLKELAELNSISQNTLSALINQQTNGSFNDFVNAYRVDSVKRKMRSSTYSNYSLLGIALESGFQSKTSFYRTFKKHTGTTPSEFKKAQKVS